MSVAGSRRGAGRRWPLWLLLALGGLGAPFFFLSTAMAGSFSVACDVAHAETCAHWRRVAIAYELLFLAAALVFLGAAVALYSTRRRAAAADPADGAHAA